MRRDPSEDVCHQTSNGAQHAQPVLLRRGRGLFLLPSDLLPRQRPAQAQGMTSCALVAQRKANSPRGLCWLQGSAASIISFLSLVTTEEEPSPVAAP